MTKKDRAEALMATSASAKDLVGWLVVCGGEGEVFPRQAAAAAKLAALGAISKRLRMPDKSSIGHARLTAFGWSLCGNTGNQRRERNT